MGALSAVRAPELLCRKIPAPTHQSGLEGLVAARNQVLVNTHRFLEFAETHLKDSGTMRNKILWSDEAKMELFGVNLVETRFNFRIETEVYQLKPTNHVLGSHIPSSSNHVRTST